MKKTSISMLRAAVATLLCMSFLIHPRLLVQAAADIKSESEFRSEATRYENALRAISAIATLKLDTPEALKQALAIFDRQRADLRFHRSKLVVLAITDPTFSSAVKKKAANKQTAEAFTKEVMADNKAILKLDGAQALVTRIRESSQADAALLRKVAERLKEAAARIKRTAQSNHQRESTASLRMVQARFGETVRPDNMSVAPITFPQDPGDIIIGVMIVGCVVLIAAVVVIEGLVALFTNIFTKEGRDKVAECEKNADDDLQRCLNQANTAPFPLNLAAAAGCDADWLLAKAGCIVTE